MKEDYATKKKWQLWNWMQILVRKIMIVAMFIHGLLGYMGPWHVNHIWVVECAYVPLAQTHPSGKLRVAYLDFSYLICRLFVLIVDIHLWTFLNFKGYIKPKIWWICANVHIQYTLWNIWYINPTNCTGRINSPISHPVTPASNKK